MGIPTHIAKHTAISSQTIQNIREFLRGFIVADLMICVLTIFAKGFFFFVLLINITHIIILI
jgi:hypothetical protein